MMGIPKILDPQERIDVGHLGGTSSSWGPTVLWDLVPGDESKLRPSARILRK
jgi:hypothetical protein